MSRPTKPTEPPRPVCLTPAHHLHRFFVGITFRIVAVYPPDDPHGDFGILPHGVEVGTWIVKAHQIKLSEPAEEGKLC